MSMKVKVFTPYNAADFLDKINIEIAETSEKEREMLKY